MLPQMFIISLIIFHTSEYILAVTFHGRPNVSLKSLLITKPYAIAMTFSLFEYHIEKTLFPGSKHNHRWISYTGVAMVVIGEAVRKTAIVTAGPAFMHVIRTRRATGDHHRLVTQGIYGIMRHPGYFGFYLWCLGTQVMMCNPVLTVVFGIILFTFFNDRVRYEESYLRSFFGENYIEYANRVPSGLPFLR